MIYSKSRQRRSQWDRWRVSEGKVRIFFARYFSIWDCVWILVIYLLPESRNATILFATIGGFLRETSNQSLTVRKMFERP